MFIPSIDLLDGKVVVLRNGKEKIFESGLDPIAIAEKLSCFPEVQVIDLNAAFGRGNNTAIAKQICWRVNARFGGGIRSIEKARELLKCGAEKIIIGTRAEKEFLSELCCRIKKEKIIVALDSLDGKIVLNGWKKKTNYKVEKKIAELEQYCSEFLLTFVEKDGTMEGIDLDRVKELKRLTNNKITIAGGISKEKEIIELEKIGVNAVVGLAFYKNNFGDFL